MPVAKPHIYAPGVYFVTFTNYKWLPLIEITKAYDLVYKWFDVLRSGGHDIIGYVIMPNHIHALIAFNSVEKSINTVIGNGKRFMAYGIIERLQKHNRTDLIPVLAAGVSVTDRKKGQQHMVFESSFDCKICHGQKFINQKLAYMHANPVSKKWMLAETMIDYAHSSAMFYETGKQGEYEVLHHMEWVNSRDRIGAIK